MAVTLTALDLAVALRISDGSAALESPVDAEVARLLASTSRLVTDYAPDAPDAIQNEAVIRVAGWLWDVPPGRAAGNPLDNSGARAMLGPYRVRRARSLNDDEDTGEDTGGDTGGEEANLEAVNQAITAAIAAHRALPNDHYDHSLITDAMARQSAAANANLIAALAARVATLEAGRLTRDNLMQGDNITLTPGTSDREVTISAAGGGFAPVELVNANFDFSSIGFVISLTAATTWKDYDWLIIDWGETLITGDNDVYGAFWVRVAKIESLERVLTSARIDANGQGNFARFELPNGQEFVLGRTGLDGLAGATTGGIDAAPLRIYGV